MPRDLRKTLRDSPRKRDERESWQVKQWLKAIHDDVHGLRDAIAKIGDNSNPAIERTLTALLNSLQLLTNQGTKTMAQLDALTAEVAKNREVDESAVILLTGLTTKIQALIDAGADPAALQALVDDMKASNQKLADAVTANTPSA